MKQDQRAKYAAGQVLGAYQRLFLTEDGKVVMEDLRQRFADRSSIHVSRQPTERGTMRGMVDVNQTLVNEGAREVVLYIEQKRGSNDGVVGEFAGGSPDVGDTDTV